MALCRVFSLDDPSACQAVFPFANVELFPTAKGNFQAEITQVGMKRIWMNRIHISLPEINTVAVKPGRRSIGFLTECNSSSLLDCGLDVRPGDMDKVDGLFEGIAREVHSARYAGSADYSDKLRCSVVEGDSPKMLR